ncbi:hypothetical protein BDV96DRAFT_629407 [Lophiotrema nucula]|uniref:Cytidyltransferase-like domain-containing protein n=1 Tax=Lophiotrema nucula TaxID=690887 RepID=A0A6A5ZKL5_9PLEO|nr:hypothetical protein BDV96DRAFT_629407 [Lophiotrema nucula]
MGQKQSKQTPSAHSKQVSKKKSNRGPRNGQRPERVELTPYIHIALSSLRQEFSDFTAPEHIFTSHANFLAPALVRGRKNRIILYAGHFNPPHIGHKLLLAHTMFRNPLDGVIAAIVIPMDDDIVREKLEEAGKNTSIILSKDDRIRLFRDALLDPWCWFFPGGLEHQSTFFDQLRRAAKYDGFELDYVIICGPDWVSSEKGCYAWECGGTDVVVGDALRPASFRVRRGLNFPSPQTPYSPKYPL